MPRHDYNLPVEWDAMTPEEKNKWFIEERCRRQAMNQNLPFRYHVARQLDREERARRFRKTKFLGRK